jgi:hypothetical protein
MIKEIGYVNMNVSLCQLLSSLLIQGLIGTSSNSKFHAGARVYKIK